MAVFSQAHSNFFYSVFETKFRLSIVINGFVNVIFLYQEWPAEFVNL